MDTKFLKKIRKIADSPDWKIREAASVEIKKSMIIIFRIFACTEGAS